MLERLIIRNFKRFDEVEIELGSTVLLIGPNNSGKTSALQALALWDLGLRRWHEKRAGKGANKRTGVAINRRDLVSVPVPDTAHFWRGRHMRVVSQDEAGKRKTSNIRIDIEVHGVDQGRSWKCGLEFDFANSESIYCRPLGLSRNGKSDQPPEIPEAALNTRLAYLPPMSGLTANETRLDPGAVQVRLGEGRTAEVLRNLCYQIAQSFDDWSSLVDHTRALFGVELNTPEYIPERGEISMGYVERDVELDLSAAGRGLQQTLLLLAYFHLHPGSVILLDEPDAHLEILRQRQIYQTLTDLAHNRRCQVIAASHSEVLLNEAADRDVVIAFVGQPHRIDDRGAQVAKSLKAIGFESYVQAEQTGWVLYLEGSTDLAILRAFAATLGHPAAEHLERPFVHYVENQVSKAADHFFGLREAKPDLAGLVILDRQDTPLADRGDLAVSTWERREIENYLLDPSVLEAYAGALADPRQGPLFAAAEQEELVTTMKACIEDQMPPAAYRDRGHPWWQSVRASTEFLDPVFEDFFRRRELPNLMRKTDYHELARKVAKEHIDPEISAKLDRIVETAWKARPPAPTG